MDREEASTNSDAADRSGRIKFTALGSSQQSTGKSNTPAFFLGALLIRQIVPGDYRLALW